MKSSMSWSSIRAVPLILVIRQTGFGAPIDNAARSHVTQARFSCKTIFFVSCIECQPLADQSFLSHIFIHPLNNYSHGQGQSMLGLLGRARHELHPQVPDGESHALPLLCMKCCI